MYIGQIFSCILFSFGAAAFYLGISASRKKFREYIGNTLLGLLCFASSVWSYGFGMVFLTSDVDVAYWGRTFGMLGVFAYMILVQNLVGVLGGLDRKAHNLFCGFACLGLIIYFPVVWPSQTTYYMDKLGMTYTFEQGIVNNIYTAYSVIYGINMLISIILMLKKAENRRSKVTGHKMLITFCIVFAGMVLDTILPMFGFGALPGSSITQFLGLLVCYYAMVDYNKTRLTPMNMSHYVYSSVQEPIMVFDTKGALQLVNQAGKSVFQDEFSLGDYENLTLTKIFELEENHFDFDGEYRMDDTQSKTRKIPVQIQTNRISDKYGDTIGFILTIKDMTEIQNMMESLVIAKKQADASNLAKTAFLANMSHEIRTPLNAIVGFSELLMKTELQSEGREYAENIRNGSYNLLAIINDILDISKVESGRMELNEQDYRLADVLRDAYLITSTLAEKKGLEFSMSMDERIPAKLYGDAVRIRGILVNILNNAVKYTRQGSVSFTGELMNTQDCMAELRFVIADTGIGIREEDMGKLFEVFKQVDQKVNSGIEGTGLGLAIVRGLLELMNGEISVESEYGKGTKFIIVIRQKIVEETPMGVIQLQGEENKSKSAIGNVKYDGIRVLVVDDNKVNLKLITRVLTKYGMTVTTADNGEESVQLCSQEEFDMILMDQMMPVMDGVTAMKEIRKLGARYQKDGACPIIALTANAVSGVREELIAEGFDEYLSKPIEFPRMEELFTSYVNEGRVKGA